MADRVQAFYTAFARESSPAGPLL